MSEYERVHFDKLQDLAKAVIDGSEIYFKILDYGYYKISFNEKSFSCDIGRVFRTCGTYIKKQPTLAELIAIKPRLCWVWDGDRHISIKRYAVIVDSGNYPTGFRFQDSNGVRWINAQMLTDEEIKQFLNGE